MAWGLDYAWSRPSTGALTSGGVDFVCRYLSHDPSKNLSRDEAEALTRAGIWVVVVWETTANRALSGQAGGWADAIAAAAQAKACGMPPGRPIYFAADWDATEGQQAAINAYLDGAASVTGRGRVGLYGGYYPVKRALDAGRARWAWQTYAWSGGRWDSRAHIQQYRNGVNFAGADVDYNRAMTSDYGQWRVGVTPEEDDMEPTTKVTITDYWKQSGQFSHDSYSAGFLWQGSVAETRKYGKRILAALEAQRATIDKLVEALALAAALAAPDMETLKADIREAIESVTVRLDVDDEPAPGGGA